MGRKLSLSLTKRAQIVALSKTGMSQVASKHLLVSRCAVQTALTKFASGGGYSDAARSGKLGLRKQVAPMTGLYGEASFATPEPAQWMSSVNCRLLAWKFIAQQSVVD